ncbi:hypothetical protein ECZU18_02430 [Escherichia coli]|nr:hypothetical protein ECZU18_02430 [Escherichia coli]
MINVQNVSKTFILHQQNGVRLPVLQRASLTVNAGECVVLHGHSGSGKSTLLRSLYANYLPDEGQIQIKHGDEWVDLVTAPARKVVEIRKTTIGWVSQFLRVIPRISALEVVMQPLLDTGVPREACAAKAARLLTRLNVPERLWHGTIDLLRRRTAARQHRPRLYRRLPHSAARRTYRLAGRQKQRRGGGTDSRSQSPWRSHRRHLP